MPVLKKFQPVIRLLQTHNVGTDTFSVCGSHKTPFPVCLCTISVSAQISSDASDAVPPSPPPPCSRARLSASRPTSPAASIPCALPAASTLPAAASTARRCGRRGSGRGGPFRRWRPPPPPLPWPSSPARASHHLVLAGLEFFSGFHVELVGAAWEWAPAQIGGRESSAEGSRFDLILLPTLVVPKRFLKHFDGNFSGTIKLESPNRGRYDVKVTKRFNKVVFHHEWGKFVDAHHIEENDYLLFRHIDKSLFEVLILESDGCEKVFPCAGIRNTPRFQGISPEYVDTSSNSHHETTESSASETAKMGVKSSPSESGEGIPSEEISLQSDDLQTPLRQDYVLSKRSYLSEAQEERVIALIKEIQPESTAFIAVMGKNNVETPCPYLAISKGYALEHFPHESTHITLQRPGKSKKWHPKFYKGNNRRPYMLRGQWLNFVHDNHVKEGDICLLFPTKAGRRSAFTVYLVPATATHSWGATGFERVGPCHGRSSLKMPCEVHIEEEPTDGENVSSEGNMCETSHESVENDSGGPSEPPYMVSLKTYLSQSQKRIVEERVRSIESKVPIFVVVMKKSNVAATHCSMIPHLLDSEHIQGSYISVPSP